MSAKIVVCASGEGTGFEAIVEASRAGRLAAEVVGLLVSRPGTGAVARAQRLKIPYQVISPKDFADRHAWDQAVADQLQAFKADWVVLAGYLCLIGPEVLKRFPQRLVNSHPALLPKFGGAGMFGIHVHRAVLNAGEAASGVTVHLIDDRYDQGQIVAQGHVPVYPGDTPELLERRVKDFEVSFYPRVLNDLVTGRITIG
jgi:phosphoribosylglycinamide formyltransferase 1